MNSSHEAYLQVPQSSQKRVLKSWRPLQHQVLGSVQNKVWAFTHRQQCSCCRGTLTKKGSQNCQQYISPNRPPAVHLSQQTISSTSPKQTISSTSPQQTISSTFLPTDHQQYISPNRPPVVRLTISSTSPQQTISSTSPLQTISSTSPLQTISSTSLTTDHQQYTSPADHLSQQTISSTSLPTGHLSQQAISSPSLPTGHKQYTSPTDHQQYISPADHQWYIFPNRECERERGGGGGGMLSRQ